jgi:Kef-type K+ transport system membrane component KefB
MLTLGRSVMGRLIGWMDRGAHPGEQSLALVLMIVLLSAVATEFIGNHAIFGAFLIGAIVPHDNRISAYTFDRLSDLVRVLMLPAFFAYTGLRTQVGLVDTAADWALCAAIIAVATAGKWGGTTIAARLVGMDGRTSSALGILMNTRGLVELIVLNIGLDLGVLTPRLFTMLVIMAVVTTMMTSPILDRLVRPSLNEPLNP